MAGVCSICIKTFFFLEDIYDTDQTKIRYYEKLKTCVPKESFYKNYKICKKCIKSLDIAYQFVCMCIKNHNKRKQIHGKNREQDTGSDIGAYKCNDCSKSFKAASSLKKHFTRIHYTISHNETMSQGQTDLNSKKTTGISYVNEMKEATGADTFLKLEKPDTQNESGTVLKQTDLQIKFENLSPERIGESNVNKSHEEIQAQHFVKLEPYIPDDEPVTWISNLNEDPKEVEMTVGEPEECHEKGLNKQIQTKSNSVKHCSKLKCEECGLSFKHEKYLNNHIRFKHKSGKTFKCDQCSAAYAYSCSLEIHKRVHTGEKPFMCSFCGKGYRAKRELNSHIETHQPGNAYPCPLCNKVFKTAGNLRKHKMGVHTSSENYKHQCMQCGHKFAFKDHLEQHIKRHAGIKNFACQICSRKFFLNAKLNLHIRTVHQNEEHTSCEECGKEFKTLHGKRKHLKVEHNLGDYKHRVPEKKFLCPYCAKMFPYNHKLQRHILSHTGERPFKCEFCPKGFKDAFGLKYHLSNSHQINLDTLESDN